MASAYYSTSRGQVGEAASCIADKAHDKYLQMLGAAKPAEGGQMAQKLKRLLEQEDISRVSQLCDALELSNARTARLCRKVYGATPKSMLRKHRLARMLKELEHRPYREWRDFLCLSYCDQSHLIRDFQHFLGMPPTQFLAHQSGNYRSITT